MKYQFHRLYWRRLDPTETTDPDEQEIIHNLLNHFSQEVHHHVVGAHDFSALYGIMVTWHDVTFGSCWSGDSCPVSAYGCTVVYGRVFNVHN